MPLQNRVLPTSDIIMHPARGAFMGNRGILHDDKKTLTHRRWAHKAWVICATSFKGRKRALMTPNRYTELFFHDEAVALAAGHRPCAECRRAAYTAYRAAEGTIGPIAQLDKALHAARAIPRRYEQRRCCLPAAGLPDGAFVLDAQERPCLIWQDAAHPFHPGGYGAPKARPNGDVIVLTPEPSLQALRGGFSPVIRGLAV